LTFYNSYVILSSVGWEVILVEEVDEWFLDLCRTDPESAALVEAAVNVLEVEGPTLGSRSPIGSRVPDTTGISTS
jgi:hypothetical protein